MVNTLYGFGKRIYDAAFGTEYSFVSGVQNLSKTLFESHEEHQEPQIRKYEPICPPDILLSGVYKDLIDEYPHQKDIGTLSLLWLLSLAKPEEREWIPEIFKNEHHSETNARFLGMTKRLLELRMGCQLSDGEEAAKLIIQEAYTIINSLGFHGTHFAHCDSIQTKGLAVDREPIPFMETLRKADKEQVYFWRTNLEKGAMHIWLSGYFLQDVAGYAIDSPEWLSEFVTNMTRDSKAFRNHLNVDEKVKEFARKKGLSEGEFLAEFNSLYDQYKTMQPIIFRCSIPGPSVQEAKLAVRGLFEKNIYSIQFCEEILSFLIMRGSFSVQKTIPPENLTAFYLPTDIFNTTYQS